MIPRVEISRKFLGKPYLEYTNNLHSSVDRAGFQPEICRSISRHSFLIGKMRFEASYPFETGKATSSLALRRHWAVIVWLRATSARMSC